MRRILLAAFIMVSLAAAPAVAGVAKIYGGISSENAADELFGPPGKPVSLEVETVKFERSMPAGSILIRTAERKLYFVQENGSALMFPVGVGRDGFAWSGTSTITKKALWPDWRPPQEMIRREAARGRFLPAMMKGGKMNPLGAAALYIGDTQYRIHGTSSPWTIGQAVSSGCIRMLNQHIMQLYDLAQLGAQVVVE